ncbi:MAG: hypothetical protein EKK55_21785 [Rhodocyclaceae bacterium]|nr:MAG: hypothetical protein EKK55_21785 [Rhodocyclaceae bacterium]
MSYLGAGADWRKRNYLIEPDTPVSVCANTGAVNRISDTAFDERWPGGVILFDQYTVGTLNPTFTPAQYGAVGAFQPYVAVGPYFFNQAFSPPGQMTGVVASPLALDLDSLAAFIANDTARLPSTTRCLSGTPFLNGSCSFFFTESDFTTPKPVVGVSVNVGFLNAVGTIRVTAYDVDANVLGVWFNETSGVTPGNYPEGFENFNLNRDSDTPIIAAVTVENLGDPAGVTTSLVRFSNECA